MQNSRLIQACFPSKSPQFESTDFASVMNDDVACSPRVPRVLIGPWEEMSAKFELKYIIVHIRNWAWKYHLQNVPTLSRLQSFISNFGHGIVEWYKHNATNPHANSHGKVNCFADHTESALWCQASSMLCSEWLLAHLCKRDYTQHKSSTHW